MTRWLIIILMLPLVTLAIIGAAYLYSTNISCDPINGKCLVMVSEIEEWSSEGLKEYHTCLGINRWGSCIVGWQYVIKSTYGDYYRTEDFLTERFENPQYAGISAGDIVVVENCKFLSSDSKDSDYDGDGWAMSKTNRNYYFGCEVRGVAR